MELGMESPIKCCDCGCDCSSPGSFIRSVKRRHGELENKKRFSIPELDELDMFSNPKIHIENECELLRETVSSQQQSVQDLYDELEKERNASATAAYEAMSMIQRLQAEKATIQMELTNLGRCVKETIKHNHQDPLGADIYVADDENYPPADSPHGREHLKTLDLRLTQMEETQLNGDFPRARGRDVAEKVMVGQRHFRRISPTGSSSHLGASNELRPDVFVDSPRSEIYSSKKVDNASYTENNNAKDDSSEIGDDMSDRVYTIDSVHHSNVSHSGVTEQKLDDGISDGYVGFPREQMDLGDPDITKLYMRLQALEADRESMKQALISMRTEKAQMVLLKEIAQHLSKEVVPHRRLPLRKASIAGSLTFTPVFKWITSFVSWRRKARRSKYMFGMSSNNIGLQMLLEKPPRSRKWRCLRSTQV